MSCEGNTMCQKWTCHLLNRDMLSSLTKEGSNDIKGPSCEQKQGNKTHNRGTKQFFFNISKCEGKPAILSLIEPYNELFVAQEVALPNPLT